MGLDQIVYLNVEMPCGTEPSDLLKIGTEAKVMNTQTYHNGEELWYVEFPNNVRTWLHEKWFDTEKK